MNRRRVWALLTACTASLSIGGAGCVVAADLVNPGLLGALGLDSQALTGPVGRVVVALTNNTRQPADFFVAHSAGATFQGQQIPVPPSETRSIVLDCPVRSLAPGTLDETFAINPAVAAIVFTGEEAVEIPYGGALLQSGSEYACGDVVSISLEPVGDGTAAENFTFRVTILPGR